MLEPILNPEYEALNDKEFLVLLCQDYTEINVGPKPIIKDEDN